MNKLNKALEKVRGLQESLGLTPTSGNDIVFTAGVDILSLSSANNRPDTDGANSQKEQERVREKLTTLQKEEEHMKALKERLKDIEYQVGNAKV